MKDFEEFDEVEEFDGVEEFDEVEEFDGVEEFEKEKEDNEGLIVELLDDEEYEVTGGYAITYTPVNRSYTTKSISIKVPMSGNGKIYSAPKYNGKVDVMMGKNYVRFARKKTYKGKFFCEIITGNSKSNKRRYKNRYTVNFQ